MRFEWDENKNEANKKKHGISFEIAKLETTMPNPCKQEKEDLLMRLYPDLSRQQAEEILAIAEMREDIDLSDIPETDFSKGVRGKFYRGPIVHLNEDLRRYFCDLSRRKGIPLNDLVNETLVKALAVAEVTR